MITLPVVVRSPANVPVVFANALLALLYAPAAKPLAPFAVLYADVA